MGKMAIILTIGMSLLIALMVLRLNSNATQGLGTTVNMFENTQARLIANSGVEIYLEKMRRNKTLTGTFLNNEFADGTYDIYISGPDSALTIRSVSNYMNVSHETIVKARRDPVPFPTAPAALYVSTSAMQNVKMTGNFTVSGFNHNKDGGLVSTTNNTVPGILVDNNADSVAIVDVLKKNTSNNITGKGGGTPNISVHDYNIDWAGISTEIAFSADQTLGSGKYNTGTFGTYEKPQITLLNGDAEFNGNLSGSGILVVNGNLTIQGTFDFKGLVIAYKESTITTNLNGTGSVIGSFIVSGNSVNMDISNGTFNALYSPEALNNAKVNLKSSRFRVLSWWE
ncbi:MAG TPA: hypothetical protein DHV28_03560 [Ignavibacteriales bacterium]|nr:hypothetical protein [Ignavibacteriales bacterium]